MHIPVCVVIEAVVAQPPKVVQNVLGIGKRAAVESQPLSRLGARDAPRLWRRRDRLCHRASRRFPPPRLVPGLGGDGISLRVGFFFGLTFFATIRSESRTFPLSRVEGPLRRVRRLLIAARLGLAQDLVDPPLGLTAQAADTESAAVPGPSQPALGLARGAIDTRPAPTNSPSRATRRVFHVLAQGVECQSRALPNVLNGPLSSPSPSSHSVLPSLRASEA